MGQSMVTGGPVAYFSEWCYITLPTRAD